MTKPKKQPNKHKVTSPFAVGDRVRLRNTSSPLGTLLTKYAGFKRWNIQWDDDLLSASEWEQNLISLGQPKRGKKK